jgi:hypothetical protein
VVESGEIAVADLFVFDFGAPSMAVASRRVGDDATGDALFEEFIRSSFVRLARVEATADPSQPSRRFVCIDAVANHYQDVVQRYVQAATTPFSIRLRQGLVRRPEAPGAPMWEWPVPRLDMESTYRLDLLPLLASGEGGVRGDAGIIAPYGRRGYVCRGPLQRLPIGQYRVEFTVSPRSPMTIAGAIRPIVLDVVAGADRLALSEERFLLRRTIGLNFSISPAAAQQAVELRIFRGRHIDFIVTAAALTRVAPAVAQLRAAVPAEQPLRRPLAFGTASL